MPATKTQVHSEATMEGKKGLESPGTEERLQPEVPAMERCGVCGNMYDKSFTVIMSGKSYVFDCFECAIHAMAPTCERCGIRIVGHGVEARGSFFCCAHCAEAEGVAGIRDRV